MHRLNVNCERVLCLFVLIFAYDKVFKPMLSQVTVEYGTKHCTHNTAGQISNEKTKVLILTQMKTGSSFLGQLFASNPEVFYMFEPLHAFNPKEDYGIKKEIKNSSEQHGYKCINQKITCRLNYLYSCQIHQFFQEARFAHPRSIHSISVWFRRIFADLQERLEFKAENAGLDVVCSDSHNVIAIKTIRIDYIEEVVALMKSGVKVRILLLS